jgi:hypothetical protein
MSLQREAVEGIWLEFIEGQLELEDCCTEDLEEDYDEYEVADLDWHEVMLRIVAINGKKAEKELLEDYGIEDASVFPVEE